MPETLSAKPAPHPVPHADDHPYAEPSTAEALSDYLAARSELFAIEAREAASQSALKLAVMLAAAAAAGAAYALVLAGLVGWLSKLAGLPWFAIAFLLGVVHLVAAAILVARLKRPLAPVFPLSRQELQKDSAWLRSLRSPANKH